ncbi:MAG: 50S ribosomal protein L11 methyltransferase [Anaeromicrobium sp.]|jgi:ribosomal protein L11 methyltransferase|uniref:50S ribosomal protein L11 methyltransferase n=1 Tax=Anaeromicrobium sp. TaxID=1929132 RepID=UPI00260080F3|nr:50S ribosomal protein L11 methyltransferase [Anaeromicrobium sp.]MCT4594603.1 50S ribosomal protein L11 methyltransferase [Anaeromicrobium sp.]
MKWIEVKIKTTTEAVEAVSNILYESGVTGVVIEDPNDVYLKSKCENEWDYFDESILLTDYEGAIVKGYLEEGEGLIDIVELIKQNVEKIPTYNLDKGLGEVTTSEVYEEDWANGWKKYYKPKKIGQKVVVKPTWEDYEKKDEEVIIELDPGMAFGTGTHETTMMCIQNLERHVDENSLVYDIGCGSGILSIGAAKLGAKEVIAVDLDPVAVESSKRNVELNHVKDKVTVLEGNLMELIDGKAHVVVANIIADIIIGLSDYIGKFIKDDGVFISSGIILDKVEEVKEALMRNNLEIIRVDKQGEWAAIVSKKFGEK